MIKDFYPERCVLLIKTLQQINYGPSLVFDHFIQPFNIFYTLIFPGKVKQRFPFRILCMVISGVTLLVISALTNWLLKTGKLDPKYDYFKILQREEKNNPVEQKTDDFVLENMTTIQEDEEEEIEVEPEITNTPYA